MKCNLQTEFGGKTLSIEAGRMARQASGSVVVRYGDTMVLVSACRDVQPKSGQDFLPLTVEYRERYYAAGKIPGGFFKREGRPTDRETLTSRLIDRPIRPLFPDGYALETQVIAFVISADGQHDPDVLAINGASAALTISDIPFQGPIGAVRIGRVDGQLVANPSREELSRSDMNIVIAGSRDAIVMVEGGGEEFSEEVFLDAAELAQREIQRSIDLQIELASLVQPQKLPNPPPSVEPELIQQVHDRFQAAVLEACLVPGKHDRAHKLEEIREQVLAAFVPEEAEDKDSLARRVKAAFKEVESRVMRNYVLREGKRADGRTTNQIRPISIDLAVLPRAHGAALFTRGETQTLATVTLGSARDEQMLDNIEGESSERFLLHYNFPPFSVGEVKFLRGPGRREIGHGALAERAVRPLLPPKEKFPYTIRVVSDILESNGSSSMASVCGASLSLMDAGVPIRAAVAGIAMGLISQQDQTAVLSDILGVEDHLGDMDFKVAGTEKGITAIQMDIKIGGISRELLSRALQQAREGRLFILGEMNRVISEPRSELSRFAPRILSIKINPDRIKDVIGPGGKVIKGIIAETGVDIDIEDTGVVNIVSADAAAANRAREIIESLTEELEIGKVYLGEVKRIESYGAFVQITSGNEGLLHVTQLADHYIKNVSDELQEGQKILVKLIDIDKQGRLKLSRKAAVADEANGGEALERPRPERGERPRPERGERPERGGRDRGDRSERSDRDADRDRGRDRASSGRGRGERNGERFERDRDTDRDRDRDRVRDEFRDRDRSSRDREREEPRDRGGRERSWDDSWERDRDRDRDEARDRDRRDRPWDEDRDRDRVRDDRGARDEVSRDRGGRDRRGVEARDRDRGGDDRRRRRRPRRSGSSSGGDR
jgi:polyribonucleotide nucleotidyltransferase